MKITKQQLEQIIKEELSNVTGENENINFFAVKTPNGKVLRVRKNSLNTKDFKNFPREELAQRAINLVATKIGAQEEKRSFTVYEYAQYGGGVKMPPVLEATPSQLV